MYLRFVIPILLVIGLWVGLRRIGLTPQARMTGIVVTGGLLLWWATIDVLARSGFYAEPVALMRCGGRSHSPA